MSMVAEGVGRSITHIGGAFTDFLSHRWSLLTSPAKHCSGPLGVGMGCTLQTRHGTGSKKDTALAVPERSPISVLNKPDEV
jgi:hypothetical protein